MFRRTICTVTTPDGRTLGVAFTLGSALEQLGIWVNIQEKLKERKQFYQWAFENGYADSVENQFPTTKALEKGFAFERKYHYRPIAWFVEDVERLLEEYTYAK